jgi:hypothetical protein
MFFKYQGPSGRPDFVGIGRYEGLIFDVSASGEVPIKLARSYGVQLITITYERPTSFP